MNKVKDYTNSVQHNVIATVIDNINESNGLTYLNKGKHNIIEKPTFEISALHGMSEILNEIHKLGYKIVKG